jgi:hypothetical protein
MINEGIYAATQKPVAMAVDADGHLLTSDSGATGYTPTGTVSLSATVASARVELPATGDTLTVRNYGLSRAYVKLGGSGISAAVTDYPIDPYSCETLARDVGTETHLAAICDTGGTATLSISAGSGGTVGSTPTVTGAVAVSSLPAASTATLSNVSGSASSVTVLAANSARKGAIVMNDSTAILYLKFGATASATSFTYKLNGGETLELPSSPVYAGIIDGIWASATGAARVTELS